MFRTPEDEEFDLAAEEALRQQKAAGSWEQWSAEKLTRKIALWRTDHRDRTAPEPAEPAHRQRTRLEFRLRELSTIAPAAAGHSVQGGGGSSGGGDMSFSGLHTWGSAAALGQLLLHSPALVRGKTVVELGAGTGLPSLAAGAAGAGRVVVTDRDEELLANVRFNAELNAALLPEGGGRLSTAVLRWEEAAAAHGSGAGADGDGALERKWRGAAQVVLGSELMHVEEDMPALAATVAMLLAAPGGTGEEREGGSLREQGSACRGEGALGGQFWAVSPSVSRRNAIDKFVACCESWRGEGGARLQLQEQPVAALLSGGRSEGGGGAGESESAGAAATEVEELLACITVVKVARQAS